MEYLVIDASGRIFPRICANGGGGWVGQTLMHFLIPGKTDYIFSINAPKQAKLLVSVHIERFLTIFVSIALLKISGWVGKSLMHFLFPPPPLAQILGKILPLEKK